MIINLFFNILKIKKSLLIDHYQIARFFIQFIIQLKYKKKIYILFQKIYK